MIYKFPSDFYKLSKKQLVEIAENKDYSFEERSSAIFHIKCPEMLMSIARNTCNRSVLKEIFRYILEEKDFFTDFSTNHPDWQIRLLSISYILNDYDFTKDCEEILASKDYDSYIASPNIAEVALKHSNYKNRMVGALLCDDEQVLNEIALSDENNHVRVAAVSGINDECLLENIIRKNNGNVVVEYASSKIKSDLKLIELYKSNMSVYHNRRIISNIHNQFFLINEVYENGFDWTLCANAVSNITNQKVLYEIVKHYAKPHFAEPADEFISYSDDYTYLSDFLNRTISLIVDDELLEKLAFGCDDFDVFRYVAETVLNPSLLADIVLKFPVSRSFWDFVQITDEDKLFEIAMNHPIENTRKYAVLQIFQKDRLRRIMDTETSDEVKKVALKNLKLNDDDFTLESDDVNVFCEALKTVRDDAKLFEIFHQYRNSLIRQIACENISDEALLKDIACNNYIFPACLAINNISSDEVLRDIALEACYDNTRIYAISKITDDDTLKYIFENSNSFSCRINAFSRVGDEEFLVDFADDLIFECLKKQ